MPKKETESPKFQPFLRWAGGKRRLLNELRNSLPEDFGQNQMRYYEPFIGGGALMFSIGNSDSKFFVPGSRVVIGDANPDLIATYKILRDEPEKLISGLRKLAGKNNLDDFLKIRNQQPETELQKAVRFIYLNKTCFNGLWRVNNSGQFNVPFGRLKNPKIADATTLRFCSNRLTNSKIRHADFEKIVEGANKGDFVYLDPPYIPLSVSSSFSKYAKEDFSTFDHERLADCIGRLNKKGVRVMLSNSDTKQTRRIFGKILELRQVSVPRTIAANSSKRNSVGEVIGLNY